MNFIPISLSVTTCYLCKAGTGYILIDTGYEEDWELFQSRLKQENVSIAQITHIILTHHHDDHCGLLHHILAENSSIRVVMSEQCEKLIRVGRNDTTHGGGPLNRRIALLLRIKRYYVGIHLHKKVEKANNLRFPPYLMREGDCIIHDGVRLRDVGINLDGTILETPGHTVDSISILFDDGDCAVGDAAANFLRFAGTKYCVIFVCNLDQYYRSWEKLLSQGAKAIFPAHGKSFPAEKLKKNLRKNKSSHVVTNF